jgi:hypothetical protein
MAMASSTLKFGILFLLFFSMNSAGLSQELGSIKGTLVDQNGEPAIFVKILVKNTEIGVISNVDGEFHIYAISPGKYDLIITSLEHGRKEVKDVIVKANEITFLKKSVLTLEQIILDLKPIIYIYPTDTIEVKVKLNYNGQLTTTYPKYNENGWKVTATPESTLIDSTGRTYYSLYWEGIPNKPLIIKQGTVVAKEETISFLEKNLEILGLSEREANEFIIYWLPVLEKNPFNLISFSSEEYEQQAELIIEPKPDVIIRVMMVYQGLEAPIEIQPQDILTLRSERKGFTVVEWGGQESISDIVNY